MPTPLIRDPVGIPPLRLVSGGAYVVSLSPLTLPAGRVVADFSGWTLTVREDPDWPRSGATEAARDAADPKGDGWAVVLTVTGTVVDGVVTFALTMVAPAGYRRYSVDAWGALSAGGEIQVVEPLWLTCGARDKA